MGEYADLMIDGESCSLCGVNFEESHGYPVACKSCWNQLSKADHKNFQKATEREI